MVRPDSQVAVEQRIPRGVERFTVQFGESKKNSFSGYEVKLSPFKGVEIDKVLTDLGLQRNDCLFVVQTASDQPTGLRRPEYRKVHTLDYAVAPDEVEINSTTYNRLAQVPDNTTTAGLTSESNVPFSGKLRRGKRVTVLSSQVTNPAINEGTRGLDTEEYDEERLQRLIIIPKENLPMDAIKQAQPGGFTVKDSRDEIVVKALHQHFSHTTTASV